MTAIEGAQYLATIDMDGFAFGAETLVGQAMGARTGMVEDRAVAGLAERTGFRVGAGPFHQEEDIGPSGEEQAGGFRGAVIAVVEVGRADAEGSGGLGLLSLLTIVAGASLLDEATAAAQEPTLLRGRALDARLDAGEASERNPMREAVYNDLPIELKNEYFDFAVENYFSVM